MPTYNRCNKTCIIYTTYSMIIKNYVFVLIKKYLKILTVFQS